MIRAVFDTNVVVSVLLQPLGPSAQLLLLALNGSIQLCITGSIMPSTKRSSAVRGFNAAPR